MRKAPGGLGDTRSRCRNAQACEFFGSTPQCEARSESEKERRGGAFVPFCAVASRKKESRTPTDASCNRSASLRQRIRRDALACRRSTSGVFLEMSEHLRPASGQASWDAAATITLLSGRYPPLPVPVQRAPRGRPRLPATDAQSRPGAACNSARGHRPRSRATNAFAAGPSHERESCEAM